MERPDSLVRCDGCGVEINWAPVVAGDRYYCCEDCRQNRPCSCGDRMELDDERRESPNATGGTF